MPVARAALLLCVGAALACRSRPARDEPIATFRFAFPVDTIRSVTVDRGLSHYFISSRTGPWAIHVLDVGPDGCHAAIAAKGALGAAGRAKTSSIMRGLEPARDVVAGVNADFFSLQTGVPTNALVSAGRIMTPPSAQPVFAVDSSGAPHIATFVLRRVVGDERVLVVDDTALVRLAFSPFHPLEALGGRPRLVLDSAIVPEVDTVGGPGFATGRHPRTAIGIASNGRRLLLVVVDGRQAPYSDGMTLRELANLMLALGARDALNLDGGGSTTMVVENPEAKALEIVNRPSDAAGERAVGNALAIVRTCAK